MLLGGLLQRLPELRVRVRLLRRLRERVRMPEQAVSCFEVPLPCREGRGEGSAAAPVGMIQLNANGDTLPDPETHTAGRAPRRDRPFFLCLRCAYSLVPVVAERRFMRSSHHHITRPNTTPPSGKIASEIASMTGNCSQPSA